jgi:hypothetical protein
VDEILRLEIDPHPSLRVLVPPVVRNPVESPKVLVVIELRMADATRNEHVDDPAG